jgi:hypothetical protein
MSGCEIDGISEMDGIDGRGLGLKKTAAPEGAAVSVSCYL